MLYLSWMGCRITFLAFLVLALLSDAIDGFIARKRMRAGVNKIYRDLILGHSLKGMDAFYLKPDDDDLKQAMGIYTAWFDEQLEAAEQTKEKEPKVNIPLQP